MYHIVNDKRAYNSAKLICDGVLTLLTDHSLNEISISSINRETGISRATFYRLFDRVEDVLIYICEMTFDEIQQELEKGKYHSKQEIFVSFVDKWLQQEILIPALVNSGMAYVLRDIHANHIDFIKTLIPDVKNISPEQIDYVIYLFGSLLPSMAEVWIKYGKKDSAEDLFCRFKDSLAIVSMVFAD